jgi:hypothetical protein
MLTDSCEKYAVLNSIYLQVSETNACLRAESTKRFRTATLRQHERVDHEQTMAARPKLAFTVAAPTSFLLHKRPQTVRGGITCRTISIIAAFRARQRQGAKCDPLVSVTNQQPASFFGIRSANGRTGLLHQVGSLVGVIQPQDGLRCEVCLNFIRRFAVPEFNGPSLRLRVFAACPTPQDGFSPTHRCTVHRDRFM